MVDEYSGKLDELTIDFNLALSDAGDVSSLDEDLNIFWTNVPFRATYVNRAAVNAVVQSMRARQQFQRIGLLGHSEGPMIAAAVAAKYPDR